MAMQQTINALDGQQAEALLCALATWGNTTTVIIQGGCVFEFKGCFPAGVIGEGFYNLTGTMPGFHGHIRLDVIQKITLQDKSHRGRQSYAFDFKGPDELTIFKVFIGRDDSGALLPEQVEAFKRIQRTLSI